MIWNEAEYSVVVVGPEWPPVAGCAVKRYDQVDLWLNTPEDQGGKGQCGSLGNIHSGVFVYGAIRGNSIWGGGTPKRYEQNVYSVDLTY